MAIQNLYQTDFYQAAVTINISNLLISFCRFDLSCPILEKEYFLFYWYLSWPYIFCNFPYVYFQVGPEGKPWGNCIRWRGQQGKWTGNDMLLQHNEQAYKKHVNTLHLTCDHYNYIYCSNTNYTLCNCEQCSYLLWTWYNYLSDHGTTT